MKKNKKSLFILFLLACFLTTSNNYFKNDENSNIELKTLVQPLVANDIDTFLHNHHEIIETSVVDVNDTYLDRINNALDDYNLLTQAEQTILEVEKTKLDSLKRVAILDWIEVEFNYNNPAQENTNIRILKGSKITLPHVYEEGNTGFVGWYLDRFFQVQFSFMFNQIYENTVIYAKWETKTIEVTAYIDSETQFVYEVFQGTTLERITPHEIDGAIFGGYYLDKDFRHRFDIKTPITQPIVLYPHYDFADNYSVTFIVNGGSDIETISGLRFNDAFIRPEDPIKKDFVFFGWAIDSEGRTLYNFDLKITSNLALYAVWTDKTATLSGLVINENEQMIADVIVDLIIGNQVILSTISNQDGQYLFEAVPLGLYNVRVIYEGVSNLEFINIEKSEEPIEFNLSVSPKIGVKINNNGQIFNIIIEEISWLKDNISLNPREEEILKLPGTHMNIIIDITRKLETSFDLINLKNFLLGQEKIIGSAFDFFIIKELYDGNNINETPITTVEIPLLFHVILPEEIIEPQGYKIFRVFDGDIQEISNNIHDNEYFIFNEARDILSIKIRRFSQFAITYNTGSESITHWFLMGAMGIFCVLIVLGKMLNKNMASLYSKIIFCCYFLMIFVLTFFIRNETLDIYSYVIAVSYLLIYLSLYIIKVKNVKLPKFLNKKIN